MSGNNDTDTWAKILFAVIAIMAFLWWRSDNSRIKWIHELQDQVEAYEQRIEELEQRLEWYE